MGENITHEMLAYLCDKLGKIVLSSEPAYVETRLKLFTQRFQPTIEDPCSKLQGISDRKEVYDFQIRSLTPQQASGNALAFSVQGKTL